MVVESASVVLTRSAEGVVAAFSAVCTHAGCKVSEVAEGKINCPCHGSQFDAWSGHATAGPAKKPLLKLKVIVEDGAVLLS